MYGPPTETTEARLFAQESVEIKSDPVGRTQFL